MSGDGGAAKYRVTKAQALEDFIQGRVMGDEKFAANQYGACVYSHDVNGGCAIGKWLSASAARLAVGLATEEFVMLLMEEAGFEQPGSPFWLALQRAHDAAALCEANNERGVAWDAHWAGFQEALQLAAVYCGEAAQ